MSSADAAWARVIEAPDDLRRADVLADVLLEQGDPLGETLRLASEAARRPTEPALAQALAAAHAAFDGRYARAPEAPRFDWRRTGLLEAARFSRDEDGRLEPLLDEPLARALGSLTCWSSTAGPLRRASPRLPATLTRLALGHTASEAVVSLAPFLERLPRLASLELTGSFGLDGARHQVLRSLSWKAPAHPGETLLAEAATWRLPALRTLSLHLRAGPTAWPLGFLSGDGLPALERLTLAGTLWPQHLEELATSGLVRRLRSLDLSGVRALPGFGEILDATADRFEHLRPFRPPGAESP